MWVFLNNSFLSIIDPKAAYGGGGAKSDQLLVRARFKGDIERVFKRAKVVETPKRDYRCRALVSRETVAQAMLRAVNNIDYLNFKGSTKEGWRHDAYQGCWGVMEAEQYRQHNKRRPQPKPEDFDEDGLDWTPYRDRGLFDRR